MNPCGSSSRSVVLFYTVWLPPGVAYTLSTLMLICSLVVALHKR